MIWHAICLSLLIRDRGPLIRKGSSDVQLALWYPWICIEDGWDKQLKRAVQNGCLFATSPVVQPERFDEWFAGENSFQTSWWIVFQPTSWQQFAWRPLTPRLFFGLQHRSNKKGQKRGLFPTSVSKRKRKPNSEKHNLPTWNPKHSRSVSSKIQLRTAIVRTATHWLGLQQEWRVTNSEKAEEEIHGKITSRNPPRRTHNQARYTSPMKEWYGKKAP